MLLTLFFFNWVAPTLARVRLSHCAESSRTRVGVRSTRGKPACLLSAIADPDNRSSEACSQAMFFANDCRGYPS